MRIRVKRRITLFGDSGYHIRRKGTVPVDPKEFVYCTGCTASEHGRAMLDVV
jgi:hypothetical protein